jgi:2-polyprenyl-6-hydroxyphenyl methylase/3-demethylubiquinone-9 3-methyltransferase
MTPFPCKICSATSEYIGAVNFNKNCAGYEFDPKLSNIGHIHYHQCQNCGFLFTTAFDGWGHRTLMERIYNQDYGLVDPEFVTGSRAKRNAKLIAHLFPPTTTCLDWGGGKHGELEAELREKFSFSSTNWCDMLWDTSHKEREVYELVTSFEVLEHSTCPEAAVREIIRHLAPDGLVLFSTHTLPPGPADLSWWYIAPRNGHVSIFTKQALQILWGQAGFDVIHLTPNRHVAQRKI